MRRPDGAADLRALAREPVRRSTPAHARPRFPGGAVSGRAHRRIAWAGETSNLQGCREASAGILSLALAPPATRPVGRPGGSEKRRSFNATGGPSPACTLTPPRGRMKERLVRGHRGRTLTHPRFDRAKPAARFSNAGALGRAIGGALPSLGRAARRCNRLKVRSAALRAFGVVLVKVEAAAAADPTRSDAAR